MTPDQFQISSSGRVVRSVLGHWTFQPNTLPPDFTPDWPTIQRMNEAERALGALAGMAGLLPNPQLLLRSFVNREAVASSRIEGTVTTLDQLLLFEVTPDELATPGDAEEVLNYVRAADFGFAQIKAGYPLSWPLVEELHRILLTGVRGDEKRPGLLRDRPVMIGRMGQTFDTARFVPPCHTVLRPPLDDLVDFLRTSTLPVIAQLAIAHYQFESIHPFNDGNGRVGRLLIALMLAARGVLVEPILYLSAYFERHRQEYYDHLLSVSHRGSWNEWLQFFAFGVAHQARDSAMRARRLIELRRSFHLRIAEVIRAEAAFRLADSLFATPYTTLSRATLVTGVTKKSAQNTLDKLRAAGLIREITGRQRYRVYCADEILALLEQPLDPEAP